MVTKPSKMTVATALATDPSADVTEQLVSQIGATLGDHVVDACLLFASAHFEDEIAEIAAGIHDRLSPRTFIGATAESVVSGDQEYEGQPAISLWAACLPDVRIESFHLSQDDLERLNEPQAWHDYLHVTPTERPHFILLGDPFSFNTLQLLDRLEDAYPGRPTLGGMASAGNAPGENILIFEGQPLHHGMCGLALWGNLEIEFVVSQGCRPIGRHHVITDAERNVIRQLGGKPPLMVVTEMLSECTKQEVQLARSGGLLIGRVINEQQSTFAQGDFLIRNPLGFDQRNGALAVNDLVRTGQTVQFHVQDRQSASDDLTALLAQRPPTDVSGALMFTCNGRGMRLFEDRNHDAQAVSQSCGDRPTAGMFCAGEIGPVGGRNFLHGHTASVGFLRPATSDSDD